MKLSKSKLALAKVINENGEWVDSADCATQDKDGWVCSYNGKPTRCGDSWKDNGDCLYRYGFDSGEKIQNWHQCVLSREEYYQAYPKADADGWIEWKGVGAQPCKSGVAKLANGNVIEFGGGVVRSWANYGGGYDIVAYRPSNQYVKPEFCESVTLSVSESRNHEKLSPEAVDGAKVALMSEIIEESTRNPTIEQLAQDYRNAKYYAVRLQKEAGEAAVKAESFAVEIRKKILELQELIG